MYWIKKLLTAAICLSIAQTLPAQQHYNAWFRSTLSIPVGSKFKIDNEFQYRRQNGIDNTNLFDKKLMFAYRNWIHYQHNENVKFSISPFAHFSNYKIIQKQTDEISKPVKEIRISAAVELQQKIVEKVYVADRSAIEYRMFDNDQSDITRLRNRLDLRYDYTKKVKLSIFHELLLNLSGTDDSHFFDHSRIGLDIGYKVQPNFTIDIGYIRIARLPASNTNRIQENNIFLNLTYQLHKREAASKVHSMG